MLTMISSEGFPPGVTVGYAKSQVKDILKAEFNKSVELQVNNHLFIWEGNICTNVCVCVIFVKNQKIFGGFLLVLTMLKDYLRINFSVKIRVTSRLARRISLGV